MNTMKLPIAEWMYRWLNENPTATIEEGLKAFEVSRYIENKSLDEISDEDIDNAANEFWDENDFGEKTVWKMGVKWYREQLKTIR